MAKRSLEFRELAPPCKLWLRRDCGARVPRPRQAGRANLTFGSCRCLSSPSFGKRKVLRSVYTALENPRGNNKRHRIIFHVLQEDAFCDPIFLKWTLKVARCLLRMPVLLAPTAPCNLMGRKFGTRPWQCPLLSFW